MQTFQFTDNLNNLDEGTSPDEILPSKKTEMIFSASLIPLDAVYCDSTRRAADEQGTVGRRYCVARM